MKVLTRGAGRLTRYRTSLKRDREREKGRLLVRSVVESRSWSGAGSLKRCVILAPVQLYNNLTSAQLSLSSYYSPYPLRRHFTFQREK